MIDCVSNLNKYIIVLKGEIDKKNEEVERLSNELKLLHTILVTINGGRC